MLGATASAIPKMELLERGSKGKEKATPALNAGKLRACVEIRR
jgi:hypothetical protein